jgi:tetratricopeptide (TPR) repeat protein
MEAIFSRATLAHDVLVNKESRGEYDRYLEEQRRARGIEELLSSAAAETQRAAEVIEREIEAAEASQAAPPTPSAQPAPPLRPSPVVAASARREALARRLLGGRAPNAPAKAPPGPAALQPPTPPTPAEAMAALRRRYEDRVAQAKTAQARKYVVRADEAVAAGDAVAAANALRVASGLAPSDASLQARAAEAQAKADALLATTYVSQAQYEEKNGQWTQAARSWTRAARGQPNDAATHERAANAIVKAGGDLHEAGRLAKRACELSPSVALHRLTLATVYLAAGHALIGRRELEAAAQLAPGDVTIQHMLDQLAKPT